MVNEHKPGAGDDVPCEKCGGALDTGLECTECGHDNHEAVTGVPFDSTVAGLRVALQNIVASHDAWIQSIAPAARISIDDPLSAAIDSARKLLEA